METAGRKGKFSQRKFIFIERASKFQIEVNFKIEEFGRNLIPSII